MSADSLPPQETSELRMKENVAQLAAQRSEISELRAKVATLEQAMGIMAAEFEREKAGVREHSVVSAQARSVELEKLQKLLSMREREMSRVKRLAREIVEQRTQLELFFHESLAQVKQEIEVSQLQYRYIHLTHTAKWGHLDLSEARLKT